MTGSNSVLLTELVSSEGLLIPTLRAVYESNKHEAFKEELDSFIHSTDTEIEKICSVHHMGFMESVDELLQVKGKARNVRRNIELCDRTVSKAGNILTKRSEQLRAYRVELKNIYTAIEDLYRCLPMLQLYLKAVRYLKEKRYYASVKALDQVEGAHMAQLQNYSFTQLMRERIPKAKAHIKQVVLNEMQDWLTTIVEESKSLGKIALDQTRHYLANQNEEVFEVDTVNWKECDLVIRRRSLGRASISSTTSSIGNIGGSNNNNDGFGTSGNGDGRGKKHRKRLSVKDRLSAVDHVVDKVAQFDFSPIYRCLHINEVLGNRDEFEQYYKNARKHQLNVVLQPLSQSNSLLGENLGTYQSYFYEIVGFFIVEDTVLSTTRRLLSRAVVEDLWETAQAKISTVLKMQAGYCKDANVLLQVKEFLVLFCRTLSESGYNVSKVYDLLIDLRERYTTVLMNEWARYFTNHFNQDNYQPLVVNNMEEYLAIQAMYPFKEDEEEQEDDGDENANRDANEMGQGGQGSGADAKGGVKDNAGSTMQFPKQLKFSISVPYVFKDIKEFIAACKVYAENINMSHTEVDDVVRKSANTLMTKTLNEVMNKVIMSKNLTLSQLVQISVNVTCLESTCEDLEDFIALITHTVSVAINSSKLYGSEIFREARTFAEEAIFATIRKKVDGFFEMADYDWNSSKPRNSPSDYIIDMLEYLAIMFSSVTNFPEAVSYLAYFNCCNYIAERITSLLTGPDVRKMHPAIFHVLKLDVDACEMFAMSLDVAHISDTFLKIKELVSFFLSPNWLVLLNPGVRRERFPTVKDSSVLKILAKFNNMDSQSLFSFASQQRVDDQNRRKQIEALLRALQGTGREKEVRF
eukprot:Nk52_evm37s147 gene=Nk52_evmTU37s147